MTTASAAAVAADLEEGVHRLPITLFGHDVWIVVDWAGDVIGVRTALPRDSARVIRELDELAGIEPQPGLKLIDPDRPASRASVLLAAALQSRRHQSRGSAPPQ